MSDECGGLTWALGSWEGSTLPPSVMMSCLQGQGARVLKGWAKKPASNSGPPVSTGDAFQAFKWMPETPESTEPYICYVFPCTYVPMKRSLIN